MACNDFVSGVPTIAWERRWCLLNIVSKFILVHYFDQHRSKNYLVPIAPEQSPIEIPYFIINPVSCIFTLPLLISSVRNIPYQNMSKHRRDNSEDQTNVGRPTSQCFIYYNVYTYILMPKLQNYPYFLILISIINSAVIQYLYKLRQYLTPKWSQNVGYGKALNVWSINQYYQ